MTCMRPGLQWICNLCLQGNLVRLETANAALLRKSGESWQEAMAEEHAWELVDVIVPQSQQGHRTVTTSRCVLCHD